jgi:hypothetical protein
MAIDLRRESNRLTLLSPKSLAAWNSPRRASV